MHEGGGRKEFRASMGSLPDELWTQILHSGAGSRQLHHRDLCAMAMVCRRLNRICGSDYVWKQLVLQEFPEAAVDGVSWKALYKIRFEKVKAKRIAVHRRAVLRVTSHLHQLQAEKERLKIWLQTERDKLVSSRRELDRLELASRTSVALQVWQPYAVSTQHEQVVQQMPVDIASRRNHLRMELQIGKSQIYFIENMLKKRESLIDGKQKELDTLEYNPLEYNPTHGLAGRRELLVKEIIGKKRKRRGSEN